MTFRRPRRLQSAVSAKESSAWLEVDQAWSVLGLVNEWVKHAETKLGLLLAAGGVSIGALFTVIDGHGNRSDAIAWCVAACAASAITAVALSVIGLVAVTRVDGMPSDNPFFFGAIARGYHSSTDYRSRLATTIEDPEKIVGRLSQQIHANALIAARKYRWASAATWALLLNVVTYGLLIVANLA